MNEGIGYILSNAAMPDHVKIGMTKQDDVATRIKQLDNTSIPVPFELVFAARVPDCRKLERTLHFVFGEKRSRTNREFFTIKPDLAKAIIELVAINEIELSDAEQSIDANKREEIQELRKRREVRTFESLNIPIGSILTFLKDDTVTCKVVEPRKVEFKGQVMSPSSSALAVIHEMGYDWKAVSGMDYWQYNGVRLCDIGSAPESAIDPER
jgi:T5orf172 domain